MTKRIQIKAIENGPLLVTGFDSIKYLDKPVECDEKVSLCRCGDSQNAPFCDGSHKKCNFSSANQIKEQKGIREWQGKTIKTYFNSNICMHAYYCQPLDDLRKRELEGDSSVAKDIAQIVTTCPSGALSFEMLEGDENIQFETSGEIEIIKGGEIRVKCPIESGDVELQERQPESRTTLCRCGLSKNKPFCDAAHRKKENFI